MNLTPEKYFGKRCEFCNHVKKWDIPGEEHLWCKAQKRPPEGKGHECRNFEEYGIRLDLKKVIVKERFVEIWFKKNNLEVRLESSHGNRHTKKIYNGAYRKIIKMDS